MISQSDDDVKGGAGNVRNAASRCVDTWFYFMLLGKQTSVRNKHMDRAERPYFQQQHQDNGTVAWMLCVPIFSPANHNILVKTLSVSNTL